MRKILQAIAFFIWKIRKTYLFQIGNVFLGLQLCKVYSKISHLPTWKAMHAVPHPKLKYSSLFKHRYLSDFFRSSFMMLGQCYEM